MNTRRLIGRRWNLGLALVAWGCGGGEDVPAESSERASFQFTGLVVAMDTVAGTITVQNDDVPGWMGPMAMSYRTDPPARPEGLMAGSRIRATVYEGDFATLYAVQVVPE